MSAGAAAGGGGLLSAIGSIKQGNDEANVSSYNADIANNNANLAIEQSQTEAKAFGIKSAMQLGSIQAGYGASGVSGASGSAQDVLRASAANAELDRLNILNQGASKANAYENEATLDMYRGGNQKESGYLGAATALLKARSSMGGK